MTAARPYRAPMPATQAYERVLAAAGAHFDPAVVDALEVGAKDSAVGLLADLEPVAR
jgi:HD-GYP domain-containing protein (c-di-GMP phosphodiesterase class II)